MRPCIIYLGLRWLRWRLSLGESKIANKKCEMQIRGVYKTDGEVKKILLMSKRPEKISATCWEAGLGVDVGSVSGFSALKNGDCLQVHLWRVTWTKTRLVHSGLPGFDCYWGNTTKRPPRNLLTIVQTGLNTSGAKSFRLMRPKCNFHEHNQRPSGGGAYDSYQGFRKPRAQLYILMLTVTWLHWWRSSLPAVWYSSIRLVSHCQLPWISVGGVFCSFVWHDLTSCLTLATGVWLQVCTQHIQLCRVRTGLHFLTRFQLKSHINLRLTATGEQPERVWGAMETQPWRWSFLWT